MTRRIYVHVGAPKTGTTRKPTPSTVPLVPEPPPPSSLDPIRDPLILKIGNSTLSPEMGWALFAIGVFCFTGMIVLGVVALAPRYVEGPRTCRATRGRGRAARRVAPAMVWTSRGGFSGGNATVTVISRAVLPAATCIFTLSPGLWVAVR